MKIVGILSTFGVLPRYFLTPFIFFSLSQQSFTELFTEKTWPQGGEGWGERLPKPGPGLQRAQLRWPWLSYLLLGGSVSHLGMGWGGVLLCAKGWPPGLHLGQGPGSV